MLVCEWAHAEENLVVNNEDKSFLSWNYLSDGCPIENSLRP